jgi:hypothetical protein
VDYGYAAQDDRDLYSDGILLLSSCTEVIDQVIYEGLPSGGSLAFDGGQEPTAADNDSQGLWCEDDTEKESGPGSQCQLGLPGTPGGENPPCVP